MPVRHSQRPVLFIICGLPFAGKSTLGRALAARFGLVEVDVDETKARLYGPHTKDAELTQEQWDGIYAKTDEEIAMWLMSGRSVVDGSRHFRRAEREKTRVLARNLDAAFILVYLDTSEPVARERWLENKTTQARRDIPDTEFEELVAATEPPASDERPVVLRCANDAGRWKSALGSISGGSSQS